VLVAIDSKSVVNAHGVLETVAALPPGQLVKATLIRNGKPLEAVIQIAQRPLPTATQD